MKKINEIKLTVPDIQPTWVAEMSDDEVHKWYLIAKRDLAKFKSTGGGDKLERAILDYEQRHGIK